jgi:hypothetical protein
LPRAAPGLRDVVEQGGHQPSVAQVAREFKRLLLVLQRFVDAAHGVQCRAQLVECEHDGAWRADPPRGRQRLLRIGQRLVVAPAVQTQLGHRAQGTLSRGSVGRGEIAVEHGERQPMTLLDTIPDPVEVGGGRQPQPRLRIDGAFVAPGQRGDQVLVFLPQPADPGVLLGPAGVRLGFFGQRDVVGHMPAPRSLAFAALDRRAGSAFQGRPTAPANRMPSDCADQRPMARYTPRSKAS